MANKKSIGATLVLAEGNFFTNAKKAEQYSSRMEKSFGGATSKLRAQGNAMKSAGNGMASMAKKVVGFVAAYASIRQVAKFGNDCIEAANGQIKAESRLEQLMMNVKGTTMEAVSSIKAYSSELQGLTTVGDEVSMVGASQLASFQMQSGNIKKLMPAMNDLAVATYGVNVSQDQMQQTANLVGKVMAGQVGALTRVGVTFNSTQEKILKTGTESQKAAALVEVLGQNFGGLAEKMAQTPEGRIVQMKNAWGDVQEVIGMRLYPMLTDLFGWLAGKIPAAQQWLTGAIDVVTPYAQNAINAIKIGCEIAGTAIKWVADNWNWLLPTIVGVTSAILAYKGATIASNTITAISTALFGANSVAMASMTATEIIATAATTALGAAVTFLTSPLTLIALAIGAVIAAGVLLYKNWDWIKEKAGQVWGAIKGFFGGIGEWFKGKWNAVKDGAGKCWNDIKETAGTAWNSIKQNTQEKLAGMKQAYQEHGGGIKGVAFAAMEGVKQTFTNGYNAVNNITGGKLDIVKNAVQTKLGQMKQTYDAHGGGIRGAMAAAMEGVQSVVSTGCDFMNKITNGKFGEMVNGIQQTMTGLKNKISDIWSGIWGAIKGFVNKIIGGINGMIRGINSISFTMPDWGWLPDGVAGARLGFHIPEIPALAKGGIIAQPGRVLVGERGPEMLDLPRGAKVTPLNNSANSGNNTNTFYITIDAKDRSDDEILNSLVPKIKFAMSNI